MNDRTDLDEAVVAARLRERQAELRALSAAGEARRRPVELDQQKVGRLSRMDALQEQAMAQATEQRREQELKRIDAALRRLDEGEYGYCVTCGEAIAPARLELDPTTPTCIDCAGRG